MALNSDCKCILEIIHLDEIPVLGLHGHTQELEFSQIHPDLSPFPRVNHKEYAPHWQSIFQYIFKLQKNQALCNPMNIINTKSNFLEKKKLEKKRTGEQAEAKTKMLALQKNVRAYLVRRKLLDVAIRDGNVEYVIMVASDISVFRMEVLQGYITRALELPPPTKFLSLKKVILSCLETHDASLIAKALTLMKQHCLDLQSLFRQRQFIQILPRLIAEGKGVELLEFSWQKLRESPHIKLLSPELILDTLLSQFSDSKMEGEGAIDPEISIETALSIIDFAYWERKEFSFLNRQQQYIAMQNLMIQCLKQCSSEFLLGNANGLSFLVEMLKRSLQAQFGMLIKQLMEQPKNQGLLSLVDDAEELECFENTIRSQHEFQNFCQRTLDKIPEIFQFNKVLHGLMLGSPGFRSSMCAYISEMALIYDDRKIMFVYKFLSDEASLKSAFQDKTAEFYSALNTKLIIMDDEDFRNDQLFTEGEWKNIIQASITKAFELTKKLIAAPPNNQKTKIRQQLFTRKSETEVELGVLTNMLNNLNRKCLRTNKIPQQSFINNDLDKFLNSFRFGVGARTIELMLKNFPFAFSFGSRVRKLGEFIKGDKLNHDRSLFSQEEINPDLIIEVRRGHEFLDAFERCYELDLRKKYKIVFFNEQGFEEEGADGGGIIKEFINRVLKSSFSDIFGMFYETENNEILPNCYSQMGRQYEFVGKIVGKAVYEGISIEQKFAQPFLNLLIGRQNTFEDLQFIDRQIYKSMRDIKKMSASDLESLQQTFTILDHTPFGEKRIVNLKYIGAGGEFVGKTVEVPVTKDNVVEFVMTYADLKCNKQLEEKTRFFKRGFLTVVKSEWLTMFSNQELNAIISGSHPNFSILQLKNSVVYNNYNEKSLTIIDLWEVLSEFTTQQKSAFLLFVTSCSRPPTMGFAAIKPLICIQRSSQTSYLPTANTCMNTLRLPDYKNRKILKQKLLYAINAKAGFEFA